MRGHYRFYFMHQVALIKMDALAGFEPAFNSLEDCCLRGTRLGNERLFHFGHRAIWGERWELNPFCRIHSPECASVHYTHHFGSPCGFCPHALRLKGACPAIRRTGRSRFLRFHIARSAASCLSRWCPRWESNPRQLVENQLFYR